MSQIDEEMRVAGTAVVLREAQGGIQTLLLRRPDSGSFPGAWVFPGGRVDDGDREGAADEADAAGRAAIREAGEEAAIRVHSLRPLSRWVPPAETPRRFRTWFFLARESGDEVRVNPGEIVEAAWLSPAEAFAAHAAETLTLFPPTWVTLHWLAGHASVDDAFAAAGEWQHFETRMRTVETGLQALWRGDDEYPDAPGEPGGRHRLTMGPPPWSYERG